MKHPEEVISLRRIYRDALIVVAAHSPRETRVEGLAKRIAESRHVFQVNPFREQAESLVERDEAEGGKRLGQNVRDTTPLADVFFDTSDPAALRLAIRRFIEMLFGYPFHTPTRDEYGMFHAKAAALRSADLSRQVGAAVLNEDGDVIALGTNEVPRPGGGLYWSGDAIDHRDFTLGYETADNMRRSVLADVLRRLREARWLTRERSREPLDELVHAALSSVQGRPSPLIGSQLMSIIEFGRAVHAEMAAIVDAARRGVSLKASNLYTTTFPCHVCARHIVGAGISRVVYIEPYVKSLVPQLYPDSISIDRVTERQGEVRFEPFVGLAPRRYMGLFQMVRRKDERRGGKVVVWNKSRAQPRLPEPSTYYQANEAASLAFLYDAMTSKGLVKVRPSRRRNV